MADLVATVTVRPLAPADAPRWHDLWAGYLAFYRQELAADVTAATWARLIDPAATDMLGRVALYDGRVVGILNAVLHANTWATAPVCYLEDLYVDAPVRGIGAGRALIAALAAEGRATGWRRIYWRTAADNATAQRLYDRVARRSGWLTYELDLWNADAAARGGAAETDAPVAGSSPTDRRSGPIGL